MVSCLVAPSTTSGRARREIDLRGDKVGILEQRNDRRADMRTDEW